MKKLPIGPIVIGLALIGLIGGYLLPRATHSAQTQPPSVVVVPGNTATFERPADRFTAVAPAVSPAPPILAPGEDPPVHREPGAINYAEKGVLPPL